MFGTRSPLLLVLALSTFSAAFRLLVPGTTAPFAQTAIGYKLRKNDPKSWSLNVSRADGTDSQVIEDGISTTDRNGRITTKLGLAGPILVIAVNSSNTSQKYATSSVIASTDSPEAAANSGDIQNPGDDDDDDDDDSDGSSDSNGASSTGPSGAVETGSPSIDAPSESKPKVPIIVGAAIGSVLLLLLLIAGLLFFLRRRRGRSRRTTFYRDRMVRPQRASSQAALVSPVSSFSAPYTMRERQDEEASAASLRFNYEKN